MKKLIAATLIATTLPATAAFADTQASRTFDEGLTYVEAGVSGTFGAIGDVFAWLDRTFDHGAKVKPDLGL